MRLDPHDLRNGGTAFFVSPDLALTAFHVIKPLVLKGISTVQGVDKDGATFKFDIVKLEPQHDRLLALYDIAPLRLCDEEPKQQHYLTPAHFDPCTQENQPAQQYFSARSVITRGFPNTEDGYATEVPVRGVLSGDQAIQDSTLENPEGGRRVELVFSTNSARNLPGLSGSPIIDDKTDWVVGVLHSYIPHHPEKPPKPEDPPPQPGVDLKSVYGAPLGLLAGIMPEFAKLCETLPPPEPPPWPCGRYRPFCILAVLAIIGLLLFFIRDLPPPCTPELVIEQPVAGELTGSLRGCANPAQYILTVFIRVGGLWWVKPTAMARAIEPTSDGKSTAHIVTGGLDEEATEVSVYVLPRDLGVAWGQGPGAAWTQGLNQIPTSVSAQAVASKTLKIQPR